MSHLHYKKIKDSYILLYEAVTIPTLVLNAVLNIVVYFCHCPGFILADYFELPSFNYSLYLILANMTSYSIHIQDFNHLTTVARDIWELLSELLSRLIILCGKVNA